MRVLFCISAIAQSRIIDKTYSISWLHKVLWNIYFLMKLLFEKATFSEPPLFKDPYFFQSSYTFLQELHLEQQTFEQQTFQKGGEGLAGKEGGVFLKERFQFLLEK